MYNPQVMMRQHHSILFGVSIGGVDFGVPVKVGVTVGLFAMIVFQRLIHGFFVQRVGAGGVHLPCHSQLNNLLYTLKGCVAAFNTDLSDGEGLYIRNQLHMKHINGARRKQGVAHFFAAVNSDIGTTHETGRLFNHFGVTDHDGTAAVINIGMSQGLDCDLRPVARGIAHGDADNRLFVHDRTSF